MRKREMTAAPRQCMAGIVFDFDGVLADSMPKHAQAYMQTLNPLGCQVTPERVFALEGSRSESIIQSFLEGANLPWDANLLTQLANAKQVAFGALGLPALYPGAQGVLHAASSHPLALVTGTRRGNLERIAADILPNFAAILTQESYENDKPHPEPYLRAAAALDLSPQECIAIENAPNGVASAKAAGYNLVIGLTTTVAASQLDADLIMVNHEELRQWLLGRA